MKLRVTACVLLVFVLCSALTASGQARREDAIWARTYTGTITLDGVLNETGWSRAESVTVRYGIDAGIPGSGWKIEGGVLPQDSTYAKLKLLVAGNQLYLGAEVHDKSVGGSRDFNRFDGFLMALKDHMDPNAPKPPAEYFYAWWYPTQTDPQPPGQLPAFIGKWATWPPGTPRTPEQIANWDAVTVVHGRSNDDAVIDQGYTVEMRFNLTPMGYDVTRPQGDIVEWNISIYDCDWFWPIDGARFSSNRVWWQGPWGNAMWYDEVHIYAKPSIGLFNDLPTIEAEYRVPNGSNEATPDIDGTFFEPAWSRLSGFDLRYGDEALRATYPGVGPYRAGQYQPVVNGGQAAVLDPGDATVKVFFKDNFLYMAFDVRDQVVQYHPNIDRWDGFIVTINDRHERGPDNQLIGRRLSFQVSQEGTAMAHDYLATLLQSGGAQIALTLKTGTTVDTLGQQADTGYRAELAVDLTQLGYAPGLEDGTLWLGVDLLDGDSFIPPSDSYGTRTWWFREYEGTCCPVWAYMDPTLHVAGADDAQAVRPPGYDLLSPEPNPFRYATDIPYALPQPSRVTLEVFDVQGRLLEKRALGLQQAGTRQVRFEGADRSAGIYQYRLTMSDPVSGEVRSELFGRMVLLK